MKKVASVAGWMAALMVACCPCTAEMSVQDGHAYGQREIDGKRIVYDFDVPEEVESVKQYRTEAVRMKPEWVEQILKPYVQKPRSGDAWDLINDRQWNDTNFCYFEQNGRYACEGGSYIGPRKKTDDRDIQAASDVVLALLKEMNLSDFEYPFYTATSQCKSIETAIEPISSEEEYIRVKATSRFKHSGILRERSARKRTKSDRRSIFDGRYSALHQRYAAAREKRRFG